MGIYQSHTGSFGDKYSQKTIDFYGSIEKIRQVENLLEHRRIYSINPEEIFQKCITLCNILRPKKDLPEVKSFFFHVFNWPVEIGEVDSDPPAEMVLRLFEIPKDKDTPTLLNGGYRSRLLLNQLQALQKIIDHPVIQELEEFYLLYREWKVMYTAHVHHDSYRLPMIIRIHSEGETFLYIRHEFMKHYSHNDKFIGRMLREANSKHHFMPSEMLEMILNYVG